MKILFTGDILADREIHFSDTFKEFALQHDYRIGNLEGPFINEMTPILRAGWNIYSRHSSLEYLKEVFNGLTLANNHIMDFGETGLNNCLALLSQNNIVHCGAGLNIEDAFKPIQLGNVYIFAVCEHEFGGSTNDRAGTATIQNMRILYKKIQEYKQKGIVIISYHGGSEIIPIPQEYIRERFGLFRDFGASLVIGNHPHVVQGCDDGIYYSLGNFFFVNDEFKPYMNSNWSLVVSLDTETLETQHRYVECVNDTIQFVDKAQEFNLVNEVLSSKDYKHINDVITLMLYRKWYPDNLKEDQVKTIHYLRCDAHLNNLCFGLSVDIGESTVQFPEKYTILTDQKDAFYIEKNISE